MVAIGGSFGAGGLDVEGLVAQFRAIEVLKRFSLEDRLTSLQTRQTTLSDLSSKLSALFKIADRFSNTILVDPFGSRIGTSSNADVLNAVAGSAAQVGSHSFSIARLASSDVRASDLRVATDVEFSGITTDQSFEILVAHPTDDDPTNRVAVTVTVTAASFLKNNEGLFKDIAAAINNAIATEISIGNLETTERVTASAVAESSGDARLVIRTGATGETHVLQFNDTDGLLATLGVTTDAQATDTTGGYITAAANLNSEFTLDGLTFTRDGNTVDDALEGVTLKFLDVTTAAETFVIEADKEAVRGELDNFIEAYNEALTFIRTQTRAGGSFRGDATYSTLAINLRGIIGSRVSGASTTDYDRLSELGIDVKRDGTLFFDDATKFEAALAANPALVSDIFNAEGGIATQVRDYVVSFTRTAGLINSSKRSLTSSITFQNERLDAFDDRLDRRVDRFRNELIRLQIALSQVQAQAAFFQSFMR